MKRPEPAHDPPVAMFSFNRKSSQHTRELWILFAISCILGLVFIHRTLIGPREILQQYSRADDGNQIEAEYNDGHRPLAQQRVRRLPQAIIIGTRKSGTRALLRFLELNPAIKAARNEVHFFDKLANFKRGLGWYREQMPATLQGELTIEKSPAYFVSHQVPERVQAMNSSIKLILIIRDPVIRLISDFSQLIANRIEKFSSSASPAEDYDRDDYYSMNLNDKPINLSSSARSVDIWRQAEQEFVDYVCRADGGIDDQRQAIKIGLYSSHLERWTAKFSRDQIHIVNGEQLIKKPHEELAKVEQFLALPPVISKENFVFNPKKGFYCLRANNSTIDSSPSANANYRRQSAKGEPVCLSKSKGRRHVKVKKELISQLQAFYAPYNEYLATLTGIKFNETWKVV